jgi:hypothetical protein
MISCKKSVLFLICIFLSWTGLAYSAPIQSSVSGLFLDGESIIITGTSFGSGPNVVIFDDFEKGNNGELISTTAGSAKYSEWDDVGGESSSVYYSSTYHLSGSMSFSSDCSVNYGPYIQKNLPSNTTSVFVCWWLYLPSGNNFPGYDADRVNWKQMWLQGSSITDDDLVLPTALGSAANIIDSWLLNGNETDPGYSEYVTINFSRGEWKRLLVWINGGYSSDGNAHFWELTATGPVQRLTDNNVNTLKSGGYFERIRPNGYADNATNSHPTFDDVYVASGANARARVEIGNNSAYSSCTNLSILTPTSWSATSIVAVVNQGAFNIDDTAYVFVIDSDGGVSAGYEVTIGSGGSVPTISGCDISGVDIQ